MTQSDRFKHQLTTLGLNRSRNRNDACDMIIVVLLFECTTVLGILKYTDQQRSCESI